MPTAPTIVTCVFCNRRCAIPSQAVQGTVTCPHCGGEFRWHAKYGSCLQADMAEDFGKRNAEAARGKGPGGRKAIALWSCGMAGLLLAFGLYCGYLLGRQTQSQVPSEISTTLAAAEVPVRAPPQSGSAALDAETPAREAAVEPEPTLPRLKNGARIGTWTGANGSGHFTVSNGLRNDAVVALVPVGNRKAYRCFYVRADSTFGLRKVRDGTYTIVFQSGADWNPTTKRFTSNLSVSRFNNPVTFETERTERGYRYTTFEVTLHPVESGTARTSKISESEIPEID